MKSPRASDVVDAKKHCLMQWIVARRHRAITWTDIQFMSTAPWGKFYSEILIRIKWFTLKIKHGRCCLQKDLYRYDTQQLRLCEVLIMSGMMLMYARFGDDIILGAFNRVYDYISGDGELKEYKDMIYCLVRKASCELIFWLWYFIYFWNINP